MCVKNNAANFQRKKAWFFWRSMFLKFCMQVPMLYMYAYQKSKKSRRVATLTYGHFANPTRSYHRAHKNILQSAWRELSFFYTIVQNYACARKCLSRHPHAAAAGGRAQTAAIFFIHIYIYRCYRYLHAKFQKYWPKKKPSFFQLKICCILFGSPCTHAD